MRWTSWTLTQRPNRAQVTISVVSTSIKSQRCCWRDHKQAPNRVIFTVCRLSAKGMAGRGPRQRPSVRRGRVASEKEKSRRGRRRRAATTTAHSTPFTHLTTVRTCCCCRAKATHRYCIQAALPTLTVSDLLHTSHQLGCDRLVCFSQGQSSCTS